MTAAAQQAADDAEDPFTAARAEILDGRGAEAARRLRALLAHGGAPPVLTYWLAASLGAQGDRAAFNAAVGHARTAHAHSIIENCGGDLARMRTDPTYAAHLADTFYAHGHVAVASIAYAAAVHATNPPLAVLIGLGLSLQHQGRIDEAVAAFTKAARLHPTSGARNFLLYCLFYVEDGVRRHAEEARRLGRAYADQAPPPPHAHANGPAEGRPLRIGYVAPNILGMQVRQFLVPVLDNHDPERVHVTLYLQDKGKAGGVRADAVRAIGHLDDDAAARLIREDGVDVLIDLWGHTAGGRLGVFARRPAPVQVSWLNYVQTTGLAAMDYLLHPDCLDVPGARDQCTETIWNIGPFMAPFRPDERPDPSPTPALANGHVTFASYNHPARLNDQTVAGWSRILRRVEGSRLVLRYRYFDDEVLQNTTLMRFAAQGVDPDRIVFEGHVVQPDYYRSYADIDMALDPAPCPGGTTSCDAVANGVPLLTLAGEDYFSRIGVAVVGPLGLDELITYSWDDYVERAVALTADPRALDALRAKVRRSFDASGRRDEAGFTRNLEDHFARMYALWEAHGAPARKTGT